ncbi:hypothetical protein KC19_1G022900 [Ceratodon purpureus]|uniref:Amino acid transporter transmembrane domain-containing protein n=3 Tax=Ceratodon purpureus TaxID=3225 RepID=A0A8T0J0I7_CERPU|nr:hypothetical protein KC19_1G022900 [Ceratodon purpureus]
MASAESSHGSQYSPFVAFIFLYNLMVGTGCLALPSVLLKGGWVLGTSFVLIVAFLSYVSVTFVLESMATANALIKLKSRDRLDESLLSEEAGQPGDDFPSEESHSLDKPSEEGIFEISKKIEMGEMAGMFFNQWGIIVFYSALILYLIGDSIIYSTLIARSLSEFFVNLTPASWAFDMYLVIFFCFSLPLCYFDFQKTKLLQMTTLAIRNISLYTMIILAAMKAVNGDRKDSDVPTVNLSALPNLFGGAVYSFMCHHSLPGIVTPMRNKSHLQRISGLAYGSVVVVYILLLVSSGFAFGVNVKDPLTFNFPADQYGLVGNLLFLFPVFTLSSTFPMLSITLRNNIDTLLQFAFNSEASSPPEESKLRRLMLTLLAVVPPTLLSYFAKHANISVDELVGFTGAFAGCAVMLIIPAGLVYCSRKIFSTEWDSQKGSRIPKPSNYHHSPFAGQGWVAAVLAWAVLSLIFNTYEKWNKLPSA